MGRGIDIIVERRVDGFHALDRAAQGALIETGGAQRAGCSSKRGSAGRSRAVPRGGSGQHHRVRRHLAKHRTATRRTGANGGSCRISRSAFNDAALTGQLPLVHDQ